MTDDVYFLVFRRRQTDPLNLQIRSAIGGIVLRGKKAVQEYPALQAYVYISDFALAIDLASTLYEIAPWEQLDVSECCSSQAKKRAKFLAQQYERELEEFKELMGV